MRGPIVVVGSVMVGLVLAACGSSDSGGGNEDAPGTGGQTSSVGGSSVGAGGSSVGAGGKGLGGSAAGGHASGAGGSSSGGHASGSAGSAGAGAGVGGAGGSGQGPGGGAAAGHGTAGSGGISGGAGGGSSGSGGAPPGAGGASGGEAGTSNGGTTAGSGGDSQGAGGSGTAGGPPGPGRGFPATAPWASFYGPADGLDLAKVASTFRVINLDADPDGGNVTPAQIATIQAGGQNRVISYMNVGSCENYRSYWDTVPAGFVSCKANTAAQRGPYDGYPDETWMDVGDADYQKLIVEYVAPRLIAQGVDGFFLDNLEIIEHSVNDSNGPCDSACSQGGLDLVRKLREAFPNHLIIMQNATSDVSRLGTTGGLAYPSLLDGISHEEVYAPSYDSGSESELLAWKALGLTPGGHPFFIGTEDYVGSCSDTSAAKAAYDQSLAQGFSPYESDASAMMTSICFWPFL